MFGGVKRALGGVLLSFCIAAGIGSAGEAHALTGTLTVSAPSSTTLTMDGNGYAFGQTAVNYSTSKTNTVSYSLSLDNVKLVGSDPANTDTISPISSTYTTLNNFTNNTYGFSADHNHSLCLTATENCTYRNAMTYTRNRTSGVYQETSYTSYISFAIKLDNNLTADTYTATQLISFTAEDYEAFTTITNMQDMKKSVCDAEPTPPATETDVPTKQLIDKRDNKKYWIAKLADGNCWMTQNLALDLSTSTALTPEDSDVAINWTPTENTNTTNARTGNASATSIQSWNLGDYVIKTPNTGANLCSEFADNITSCSGVSSIVNVGAGTGYTDGFTATGYSNTVVTVDEIEKKYDEHYLLGNYYTWNAATAGTGGAIVSTAAPSSICPKGWRLPEHSTNDGSFYKLISTYGITNSAASDYQLGSAPVYIARAGYIYPASGYGLRYVGISGYFWLSMAKSDASLASYMLIQPTIIEHIHSAYRTYGQSVRCVANTEYSGFDELGIEYMQDMTSTICDSIRTPLATETTTVPTKQLIDKRDNKKYWVAKLADGHCWMTQNLALDLSTDITLTPDDTDISASWTPPESTNTTNANTGNTSSLSVQSWNFGEYVLNSPAAGIGLCVSYVANLQLCSGFSSLTYVGSGSNYIDSYIATGEGANLSTIDAANQEFDAHYLIGNYYTYNAATASSGGTISNTNASSSICPKNWSLPEAGASNDMSWGKLIHNVYSHTTEKQSIPAPTYLNVGGSIQPSYGIHAIGGSGYITKTATDVGNNYILYLSFNLSMMLSNTRYFGYSVRCAI